MPLDSAIVANPTQTVRPAVEAERQRPDGRSSKREGGKQRHDSSAPDEHHPTTNDRGETVGKLIDVTA